MDAVYEIGRLFRNEGMDRTHNPEFTTIEVYKAFSDLEGMMDLLKELSQMLQKKFVVHMILSIKDISFL